MKIHCLLERRLVPSNQEYDFQKGKNCYILIPATKIQNDLFEKKKGQKKWSIKQNRSSSVELIEVRKSKNGDLYFYIPDIKMPVVLPFTDKTKDFLSFILGVPVDLRIILYLMNDPLHRLDIQNCLDMFLLKGSSLLVSRKNTNFIPEIDGRWTQAYQNAYTIFLENISKVTARA
ncbi:MAG: hypothetical protein GY828_06100 [Candidatus Gracilibacteria bacterium]|nr:hypothetical protein [Candidatus Gracilibacteria bacterium]